MVNKKSKQLKKKKGNGVKMPAPKVKVTRLRRVNVPGSFAAATEAPFSKAAEGVRIPDGCPIMSNTVVLTKRFDLTADSGGFFDAVILPNLATSVFCTHNNLSDSSSLVVANTATGAGANTPVSAPSATGFGFDFLSLSSSYSKYRVAAIGARLRGQSGVSTTGEVIVAVHPLKGLAPASISAPAITDATSSTALGIPSYAGTAGPRATLQTYLESLGLPVAGSGNSATVDIGKMVGMPCHAVASLSEIAARGLHMRSVPFESSARDYRSMNFWSVGTDAVDAVSTTSGTYNQNYSVDLGCWKVGGFESIIIGGYGIAAGSKAASLEIIYHLEVIPNPQLSTLARPTSSIPRSIPPAVLDQQLAKLHRIPRISFSDIVTQVGDSLLGDIEGRAAGAAAKGLASVGGMLARLTSMAL